MSIFEQITLASLGTGCFQILFESKFCVSMWIVRFASEPMVGSPKLPLEGKGVGLSGEISETWPDLLYPLAPGVAASHGVLARPFGGCFATLKKKSLYDPELLCTKFLMPFKYLDACSIRNAFLFKIKVKF